jgi:hypothetical protein
MIPKITKEMGTTMFLVLRGYMCSRCNKTVFAKCYKLPAQKQVDTILTCMCEYGALEVNDEKYPGALPEVFP